MKGLTVTQLCEAKGFLLDELTALGVVDGTYDGQPCVEIRYHDAAGAVARVKRRLVLEGKKRFQWSPGAPTMPYGLYRLAELEPGIPIVLVEGESDCWSLWLEGFAALGIPGVNTWKSEYAALVGDRPVFVWQESDDAGPRFAKAVTADLPEARVILAPSGSKDPAALRHADRTGFRAGMDALMAMARSPRQDAQAAQAEEAISALAGSGDLLDDPNILDRVESYIIAAGYAGDTTAPRLVFISLTSRCLRRPLNLAIVAASASGKNAAIDPALPLFPPTAYVMVKASSPRALVYGSDDLEHRVVIVGEIDSIPTEDGPASSAIRSIAADNAMAYDVVERDEETGKWGVRHIVKPGPTGLVTTSTKPLREQLSTRMLAISIPDTAEHRGDGRTNRHSGRRPPTFPFGRTVRLPVRLFRKERT